MKFLQLTPNIIRLALGDGDFVGLLQLRNNRWVVSACTFFFKCTGPDLRAIGDEMIRLNTERALDEDR